MVDRDDTRSGETRLQRWSRIKREAKAEKSKEAERQPAPSPAKTAAITPAARSEPVKSEEQKKIDDIVKDLPPIESLGKDSDYTLFMREGVPEDMRQAALRKLWRSDPAFLEQFPYEMHMEDYNKTFRPMNAATDTIFRGALGYLFDDEKDKEKPATPSGTEVADRSTPGASETASEPPSESVQFLPAAEENSARTGRVETSERRESPVEVKISPPKS